MKRSHYIERSSSKKYFGKCVTYVEERGERTEQREARGGLDVRCSTPLYYIGWLSVFSCGHVLGRIARSVENWFHSADLRTSLIEVYLRRLPEGWKRARKSVKTSLGHILTQSYAFLRNDSKN
jgi:hypothetical protein